LGAFDEKAERQSARAVKLFKKARPARVKFPRFNELHSTTSSSSKQYLRKVSRVIPLTLSKQQARQRTPEPGEAKERKVTKREFTIANAGKWEKGKPQAAPEEAVCMLPGSFLISRLSVRVLTPCVCVNRRSSIFAMLHYCLSFLFLFRGFGPFAWRI
jgi:hypothetical protein